MTKYPKGIYSTFYILFIFLMSLPLLSANEDSTSSRLSLEGIFQAHSVAGPSSPWMGFGPLFRIFDSTQLGLRGFVPICKPFDKSTYSIQGFLRLRLRHGENTDLFVEPDYAMNFYTVLPFSSYGIAIGALYRVSRDFSVGFTGGIETAKAVVDSIGLERRSTYIVYPKIALFANFSF